jgi:hypothetical protein
MAMSPDSSLRTMARVQLGLGLAFVVSFVFFCIWARFPILYRDDWEWLGWMLTQPPTLRTIFTPHNEHLIPLPRLLVALQYRLAGSDTRLMFAVALASQLAVGWLFWREIRRRWPDDRTMRAFVFGAAAVCLFFSHQLQSIVFMAAVLFPLVEAFAVASVVAALNASEPGGRSTCLVAAGLAAAGAALTTTNGFAAPFLVALILWTRGASRTRVGTFAAAGLLSIGAYVIVVGRPWLRGPVPGGMAWNIPPADAIIAFFLTFFASAVAYGSLVAAAIIGAALFGLGCFAVWSVAVRRTSAPRIEHFAVGVMLFSMLSALMATPGRAQFGALQAAQSRYASYALAYIAAVFIWSISRVSSSPWWSRNQASVQLSTAIASCAVFLGHAFIGTVWKAKADNMAFVGLALAADVDDDQWIATLHPWTWVVHQTTDDLRRANKPYLRDPLIGTRVAVPSSLARCDGTIELESVGLRVGWRAAGVLVTPAESGAIVDRSGVRVGLARRAPLIDRPNPLEPEVVTGVWNAIRDRSLPDRRWLGFARRGDGAPYTFYGLDGDGQARCQIPADAGPEPIHVFLDAPRGKVSGTAVGNGWAFQCGGAVERIAVVVDGVEQQPIKLELGVPRPDVQTFFAKQCDVGERTGFEFVIDTGRFPPGRHQIKATASNARGLSAQSPNNEIVVP